MKLLVAVLVCAFTISVSSITLAKPKPLDESSNTLIWGGCGITKKAFMTELAKAFEVKTGIKIKMQGGGATKGIRSVSNRSINITYIF